MKKIVDFCKICLNHNEKKYDLKEKVRSRPSSFKNGMCQVCEFEIKKKQGKQMYDVMLTNGTSKSSLL